MDELGRMANRVAEVEVRDRAERGQAGDAQDAGALAGGERSFFRSRVEHQDGRMPFADDEGLPRSARPIPIARRTPQHEVTRPIISMPACTSATLAAVMPLRTVRQGAAVDRRTD